MQGANATVGLLRMLAVRLRAGRSPAAALEGIATGGRAAHNTGGMAQAVGRLLAAGLPLEDALARCLPGIGEPARQRLRAARLTGGLAEVCTELAAEADARRRWRRAWLAASVYPACVLTLAALVGLTAVLWLVPTMAGVWQSLMPGGALPRPLAWALYVAALPWSRILAAAAPIAVLACLGLRLALRQPAVACQVSRVCLRLPLIGGVMRLHAQALVAHTLGRLLQAGLPLPEAIQLAACAAGPACVRKLADVALATAHGRTLSEALRAQGGWDVVWIDWIDAGEQGGGLSAALAEAAGWAAGERDQAMRGTLALVEPAMVVAVGGCVALLAWLLLAPLMQLLHGLGAPGL
jgi:type IV pilus assembly protein PilC